MAWQLIIDVHQAGRRLDHILRGTLPQVPLSTLYRWLRQGLVRLNGKKTDPAARPAQGDRLTLPEAPPPASAPARSFGAAKPLLQVPILLETSRLLLLNKPPFLCTQPGGAEESLIEQVWRYLQVPPQSAFKPSLLNRLDRDVSGVVAVAKDGPTLRSLSEAFRGGGMEKKYLALVFGCPAARSGMLAEPLSQPKTYRKGIRIGRGEERMKAAQTDYAVLLTADECALLEIRLHTGRKHQVRRHLAQAGHPLIGDDRYGEPSINQIFKRRFQLRRPLLHAFSLAVLPPHQPHFQIQAPLPADLTRVLTALGLAERLPAPYKKLLS